MKQRDGLTCPDEVSPQVLWEISGCAAELLSCDADTLRHCSRDSKRPRSLAVLVYVKQNAAALADSGVIGSARPRLPQRRAPAGSTDTRAAAAPGHRQRRAVRRPHHERPAPAPAADRGCAAGLAHEHQWRRTPPARRGLGRRAGWGRRGAAARGGSEHGVRSRARLCPRRRRRHQRHAGCRVDRGGGLRRRRVREQLGQ